MAENTCEELCKALRQAERQRQIIIVSNNGNVVVNSDADQVIIAGRNSQGEISYVSGGLENAAIRARLLAVLEGGEDAVSAKTTKVPSAHMIPRGGSVDAALAKSI